MEHNTEKLLSAIGDVDAAYLEEALDFDAANAGRKRAARFPKLSAACVAVLVILGVSVTAFAVSRLPLSWRDIFSSSQTVIGDEDEVPVISQQQQPEQHQQQAVPTEEMQIKIEKVISDERALYLLYSVKANEGAVLDQSGQFADFELYFPGQMMSGAYVSSFLPRKEGVPENELEGVVYANWQPGSSANGLVMTFANWQEKRWFDHETIDFNVAEMVENAGENAKLPQCQQRFSQRNGAVLLAAGGRGRAAALRRVHLQRRMGGRRPPTGDERAGGFGRMVRVLGDELVFPGHADGHGHLPGVPLSFRTAQRV